MLAANISLLDVIEVLAVIVGILLVIYLVKRAL